MNFLTRTGVAYFAATLLANFSAVSSAFADADRTEAYQPHHGAQCVQNQGAYILEIDWYDHDAFWYNNQGYLHVKTQDAGTLDYTGVTPVAAAQTDLVLASEIRCWQGDSPAFAVLKVKDAQVVKSVSIVMVDIVVDVGIAFAAGLACVGTEGIGCPAAAAAATAAVVVVDAAISTTIALAPPDPKKLAAFSEMPEFENTFAVISPASFGIVYVQQKHSTQPAGTDAANEQFVAIANDHPGKLVWTYGAALTPGVAKHDDFLDLPVADWNETKAWDRGCTGGVHTFHVRCENIDDTNDWRTYCQPYEVGQLFQPERYQGDYFKGDNRKRVTAVSSLPDRAWMEVQVSCTPNYDWRVTNNAGGQVAHWKYCEGGKSVYDARCEDENGNYSATACAQRATNKTTVTFGDGSTTTGVIDTRDSNWIRFTSPSERC
jgi:hypothetical protein